MLTAQEKATLTSAVSDLIEADEPMAMLAMMLRIAQRMAFRAAKKQSFDAALRWQALADALEAASLKKPAA